MATVSNPATLSSVVSVFGGPNNLTAYYRGGSYVFSWSGTANIATSASSLKLSQFSGAVKYNPIVVTVSPSPSTTTKSGGPLYGAVTSGVVTASATGGTGSYTYSWTYVSGSTNMTCNSPSAAATSFSTETNISGAITTVWKVTVSDGTTSNTYNESVTLDYESTT